MTSDFNFVFTYGFGNILNTFEGTYTKDMVMDKDITIPLVLTNEELIQIYNKIVELDIFNVTKPLFSVGSVTPCWNYRLKAIVNREEKNGEWSNCTGEFPSEIITLGSLIRNIIESRSEYKKLPEPRGGYY
jgi:hypothetical protein